MVAPVAVEPPRSTGTAPGAAATSAADAPQLQLARAMQQLLAVVGKVPGLSDSDRSSLVSAGADLLQGLQQHSSHQ